jgi:peptidoglycan/xylan/chitin deacetylase (PgdA/CDA1 family)
VEPRLGVPEEAVEIATPGSHALIPHPSDLAQGAIPGSMIVLNFHCIGKPKRELADGEEDVCVDRQEFVEILDAVSGRGDVRLTFDDGNSSDVTEALPELTRRGLRAQFFICPARLGTDGFVDQDDVRELRLAGMSLGSHGMDHVRWRRLERSAIDREIVQAKQVLEDALQAPIDTAACPFGAYDRRTLRALRAAGFKRVYTSDGGRASPADWLVARNTVCRWDSAESVERMLNGFGDTVSPVDRAKRWIKRWR